jgi:hypothetical protein
VQGGNFQFLKVPEIVFISILHLGPPHLDPQCQFEVGPWLESSQI